MKYLFLILSFLFGLLTLPALAGQAPPPPPLPETCNNLSHDGADGYMKIDATGVIQAAITSEIANGHSCIYSPYTYVVGTLSIPAKNGFTIYGDGDQSGFVSVADADILQFPSAMKNLYLRDFDVQYIGKTFALNGACLHALGGLTHSYFMNVNMTQCAYGGRLDSNDGSPAGSVNTVVSSTFKGTLIGMYTRSALSSFANTHYSGNRVGYYGNGTVGETRMYSVVLFGGGQSLAMVCDSPNPANCGQASFRGGDIAANFSTPDPRAAPIPPVASLYGPGLNSQIELADCWFQNGTYIGSSTIVPSHVTITGGSYGSGNASKYGGNTMATQAAIEIVSGINVVINGVPAIESNPGSPAIQIDSGVKYNSITGNNIHGQVWLAPSNGQTVVGNTFVGIGKSAPVVEPTANANTVATNNASAQ